MVIILDGFDTTGKSNFALYLAQTLGFFYVHNIPSYSMNLGKEFYHFMKNVSDNIVIDRFHLTDLVYGKVVCEHTRIGDEDLEDLERLMLNKGVVFIHCTAKVEIVMGRYKYEENRYVPESLVPLCLEEYGRQFERLRKKGFRVFELDSSKPMESQMKCAKTMILDLERVISYGK